MNIFITGASGFIGGAIAAKLRENHNLLAMSRSEKTDLAIKELGAEPIRSELGEVKAEHLHGVDVIIHSAAFVSPWGKKEEYRKITIDGTAQLLKVAKEAGVKRFIHISSEAALFAGQDMLDIDETYNYPKKHKFLYPWSKAESEKLVRDANQTGKFETIVLRPRLVWGPGDQTVLPALVEMVNKGQFAWMDEGRYETSTTHIQNFVHAVKLALTAGRPGEVYFITDGEKTSFREFLTKLLATRNIVPPSKSIPSWFARTLAFLLEGVYKIFFIRKEPPLTRFAANIMSAHCTIRIDKARLELNYSPQINIDQGLKALSQ
ncbi:NAD-dependent epimerase/dehydratase family protein [Leptospira sp. GIMC2001]|uniref:NAD-dependent epimerase/dehydratase family protein n=1 Tax=Leptospira sp. GIMC2001 TaxID=1513297 RepID=UPI002349E657|nr:NAD-dependent epimerase/dehydratase family protein [Leptospira sp. GIMC2001]WCL48661.1 NAD-dependent epimerase/dehydratase family protein [Leptospira sp. GIMC2001]